MVEELMDQDLSEQAQRHQQQLHEQLTQMLALQQARMEAAQYATRTARELERVKATLAAAHAELARLRSGRAESVGLTASGATSPLRRVLRKARRGVRRVLRRAVKFAWWTLTLQLRSKLRARRSKLPAVPLTPGRSEFGIARSTGALTVTAAIGRRFSNLEPLRTRPDRRSGRRISIVTDSINPGLLYGGVGTSIALATFLARRTGADLRLITRHQEADPSSLMAVQDTFGISSPGEVACIFAPPGGGSTVPVSDGDIFLTTSWWSTQATLPAVDPRGIIYLLQEDERMFYPHGDERLRCAELLGNGDIHFIVNSELLFQHLGQGGEALPNIARQGIWFEPAFPLAHYYDDDTARQRRSKSKRNFLFYARPNNLRNLYWRGLEAIAASIEDGILLPGDWNFIFVGRDLEQITLPRGVRPTILENLSWQDYAALIRQIDVGLTLIDTPHPSYPPLDLAASGAVAVTNRCGPKISLGRYSNNIMCVNPTTNGLKRGIADAVVIASDNDLRLANYNGAKIARDWNETFEPVSRKYLEWVG